LSTNVRDEIGLRARLSRTRVKNLREIHKNIREIIRTVKTIRKAFGIAVRLQLQDFQMFFVEFYASKSEGERNFEMQKLKLVESIDTAL